MDNTIFRARIKRNVDILFIYQFKSYQLLITVTLRSLLHEERNASFCSFVPNRAPASQGEAPAALSRLPVCGSPPSPLPSGLDLLSEGSSALKLISRLHLLSDVLLSRSASSQVSESTKENFYTLTYCR